MRHGNRRWRLRAVEHQIERLGSDVANCLRNGLTSQIDDGNGGVLSVGNVEPGCARVDDGEKGACCDRKRVHHGMVANVDCKLQEWPTRVN